MIRTASASSSSRARPVDARARARPGSARSASPSAGAGASRSAPASCTTSAGSCLDGQPDDPELDRPRAPLVGLHQRDQRLQAALSRRLAGAVGVLAEQRLRRQAGDRVDLLLGQRRAHLGDGLGHAGLMERDHVGVALDDHHPPGLGRRGAGHVLPVDDLALVEDLAVGRVEVLRLLVRLHRARAEAEDVALGVGERERHAPAEAIDVPRAAPARLDQARGEQLLRASSPRAGSRAGRGRRRPARSPRGRRAARPPSGPRRARYSRAKAASGDSHSTRT